MKASTGNILDFSAASSGERSPLFQPIEGSFAENSCDSSVSNPRKVPDAVNENGRVALSVLDVADRATGTAPVKDGLQVGDEGVAPSRNARTVDSQISCEGGDGYRVTPLYLLASEIVDIVTKGYEQ